MNHSFDINLATQFGIEESILIHHFRHWINFNYRLKRNLHEGRYWTYQTAKEIAAHFPYLNEKKVNRIIENLVDKGVLIKGNYNKSKWDRTIWYALVDQSFLCGTQEDVPDSRDHFKEMEDWESSKNGKCISQKREMEKTKTGNQKPENGEAIPDTKPDTETDKKEIYKEKEPKINFRDHITLAQEEYDKIKLEYGDWIDRALDVLEAHKASSGKPYKNDYAVFKKGGWLHDKFLAERDKTTTSQAKTSLIESEDRLRVKKNLNSYFELKKLSKKFDDFYQKSDFLIHKISGDGISLALPHESFIDALGSLAGVKVREKNV